MTSGHKTNHSFELVVWRLGIFFLIFIILEYCATTELALRTPKRILSEQIQFQGLLISHLGSIPFPCS